MAVTIPTIPQLSQSVEPSVRHAFDMIKSWLASVRATGGFTPTDEAQNNIQVGITSAQASQIAANAAAKDAATANTKAKAAATTAIWTGITGDAKPDDNATVGAQAGVNLVKSDGVTVLGEADVITSQGTAAAITGQGALATQSTTGLAFSNLQIGTYSGISSSATIQISFGPGLVLMDSSGTTITLSSGVSGQTLNSAVTGAGGFDNGPPGSSGLYYIHEIYDRTTQTPAALLSLSATSPTLPVGYTYSRWIGVAFYQQPVAKFFPFIQCNYDFFYTAGAALGGAGTQTIDLSSWVPPNTLAPYLYLAIDVYTWNTGNVGASLSMANAGDNWAAFAPAFGGAANQGGTPAKVPHLVNQRAYITKLGGGTGTIQLWVHGFQLSL